jgi:hypothetical protein
MKFPHKCGKSTSAEALSCVIIIEMPTLTHAQVPYGNAKFKLTGARSVHFTLDVGHTGLVSKVGSEMDWCGWVILGESLALSSNTPAPLFGEESQGPVAGSRKLTMRL